MLDLSELTPAPWESRADWSGPTGEAFIKLARQAFDVMMRRGWWEVFTGKVWIVEDGGLHTDMRSFLRKFSSPHPFTALVEADKWLKSQEAKEA